MLETNLNLVAAILLTGFTCSALAADDPLFQSDEPLALVLELPPRNQLPSPEDKPTVAVFCDTRVTTEPHRA
jgi:hypothetical protein